MASDQEFFIQVSQTENRLFVSRPESIRGEALSPCCMTADDVDYEMAAGKDPEILEITGMNQESLEYFVQHYGKTYRYLSFFKCQLIRDFSPLEDLAKLESVAIHWNIRADRLWDLSKNDGLRSLRVTDAKRITLKPDLMKTSKTLEEVYFSGGFNNYALESLESFADMPQLRHLSLRYIRLQERSLEALKRMPKLERFDFDPGMLTTEEIAWIVAKHPALSGRCLCAYNTEDASFNDVRVCGFRKPGLDLPQHQKRLDKYVSQFNALVEKYRTQDTL